MCIILYTDKQRDKTVWCLIDQREVKVALSRARKIKRQRRVQNQKKVINLASLRILQQALHYLPLRLTVLIMKN